MKLNLKNTALYLLFFLFVQTTQASHVMGGDISYRWLGHKKYEFTFNFYRDCRGIPIDTFNFKIFNASKTIDLRLFPKRTSITDITVLCSDTMQKYCTPVNKATTKSGVERHIYVATVDLESAPYKQLLDSQVCEIYVSADLCCRNGTISTILPGNFFIQAMINVCACNFKNSSPSFIVPGNFYTNCIEPFRGNLGGTDTYDGDSISYELTSALKGFNTNESYTGSFTPSIPMTPYCPPTPGYLTCRPLPNLKPPRGFYFNERTGEIVFTPTSCSEVGIIALRINEFRRINGKWVKLGYVMRDVQITVVIQSSNEAPWFSTSGYGSSYNFKLRKKTCFDMKVLDADYSQSGNRNLGDSTRIQLVNPLPGMEFSYLDSNAKNKTGRLCWTPPDSILMQAKNLSKQILLFAEAFDYYCPLPAMTRKTFTLNILPPDSFGYLNITTYHDINNNRKFDNNENTIKSQLYIQSSNSNYSIVTDDDGEYKGLLPVDSYKIGTQTHPYYDNSPLDTLLKIKDSAFHFVEFPRVLKKGVHGRIYQDLNANCKFDDKDIPVPGVKLFTDSGKIVAISDEEGKFYLKLVAGHSYKIETDYYQKAYKINCPSSKSYSLNYSKDSAYTDFDFAVTDNPDYFDLRTYFSMSQLRRGTNSNVDFICDNIGNKTAYDVKLHFTLPNGVSLNTPSNQVINGPDTLEISIDSIQPKSKFTERYSIVADPNIYANGDQVCFKIMTDSLNLKRDSAKGNNVYRSCIRVSAPHDPNYKISTQEYLTPLDNSIDYTIHFQNTGSDTAYRVVVTDTIKSQYLDLSRFELNWSDAPCTAYIAGNVLYFMFDNIRLPHLGVAGDKSISGFGFRLGLKNHRTNTAQIVNKAGIYFDFESEVQTKSCTTDIKSPVEFTSANDTQICLNKKKVIHFSSQVELTKGDQYSLEMSDINGSFASPVLLAKKPAIVPNDTFHLALNNLAAGNRKIRINLLRNNGYGLPSTGVTIAGIDSMPKYTLSDNIQSGKLCQTDTLKLQISGNNLYKFVRNNNYSGPFSNKGTYSSTLALNDQFKVLVMRMGSACTDTTIIPLTIVPNPKTDIEIVNPSTSYCEGDTVTLKASGANDYQFFNNYSPIQASSAQNTILTKLNSSNSIFVKGTDANNCADNSDTLLLNAHPLPTKPTITANKNLLSVPYYPDIEWYRDGRPLNDTGNSIKKAPSGSYKVKVSNQYGCSIYSDTYNHTYDPLSINDKPISEGLNIYPIPCTTFLYIESELILDSQIELFDSYGRLMGTYRLEEGHLQIDMSTMSKGLYWLRIGQTVVKVMKG